MSKPDDRIFFFPSNYRFRRIKEILFHVNFLFFFFNHSTFKYNK